MPITENTIFENLEFIIDGKQPENKTGDAKPGTENKEEPLSFSMEEIQNSLKEPKTPIVPENKTEENIIEAVKKEGKVVVEENKDKEAEEASETGTEGTKGTPTVFSTLSEMFKEKGFLEKDFASEDEMLEALSEKVSTEANEVVEKELASRPEVIQELIKNWKEGVPLDELIATKSAQMRYASIDEAELAKDEDLQKEICALYFRETTKFSEEKIKKEVNRLADVGELLEESKSNVKALVEVEKDYEAKLVEQTRKDNKKREEENVETLNKLHKQVKEIKEIIPGVKISEKEAEELFKNMTTAVEVRGNKPISMAVKMREKDPVKFDITLAYLIKQGVFEGDWSKITKKAETKATSKFEKQLDEAMKKVTQKGGESAAASTGVKTKDLVAGLEFSLNK